MTQPASELDMDEQNGQEGLRSLSTHDVNLQFDSLGDRYIGFREITNLTNPNRRILIVDDQLYNIQAMKLVLEHSVGVRDIDSLSD